MARVEIHTTTYNRPDAGYKFLPIVVACAYEQSYLDWKMRIFDEDNGHLDQAWLFKSVCEILRRPIDTSLVEYNKVLSIKHNGLCARRDIMRRQSDCEIISIFDDDDVYLPNYLQKTINFFDDNPECSAILSSNVWRYNLTVQEYTKVICYSGGCQWSIKKALFDKHKDVKYCHRYCVDGGEMRHIAGACRDACIYQQIKDIQPKIETGKSKFDESIRMLHPDNTRADRSWLNDVIRFGMTKDVNFKWLKSKLPECFHQYYFTEIIKNGIYI